MKISDKLSHTQTYDHWYAEVMGMRYAISPTFWQLQNIPKNPVYPNTV